MATSTSTVDAALDALLTAFRAMSVVTSLTTPIDVHEGPPDPSHTIDVIVVGDQIDQTYTPHVYRGDGGPGWLEEEFRVGVTVYVFRGADQGTQLRKRCTTIVGAIDDSIRNDPTLGNVVLTAYPVSHRYTSAFNTDNNGRIMRCEIEILCSATP
jgi:hypothetical protein